WRGAGRGSGRSGRNGDRAFHRGMDGADVVERAGCVEGEAELLTGLQDAGIENALVGGRVCRRSVVRPGHGRAEWHAEASGRELKIGNGNGAGSLGQRGARRETKGQDERSGEDQNTSSSYEMQHGNLLAARMRLQE